MPLLNVCMSPGMIEFILPRTHEMYSTIDTPSLFDITHGQGKVAVEVRDGRLMLGWSPVDKMVTNLNVMTTYHRVDRLFYPEVLIPVVGYVEVVPRLFK